MTPPDERLSEQRADDTLANWRVTYTPGDWVVLAGPDALVVMPPAPARVSAFLTRVWEAIVPIASVDALIAELTSAGVTTMPDMAALFWPDGSMHSLVRGRLRVVDPATGGVLAAGEGVRTWSEIGLGDVRSVRIEAADESAPGEDALRLPLVVGAVRARTLLVDTAEKSLLRVHASVAAPAAVAAPAPVPVAAPAPAAVAAPAPVPTAAPTDAPAEDEGQHTEQMGPWQEPEPAPEPSPAVQRPVPANAAGAGQVMALLRPSTGAPVLVDSPVLIGRAPSPDRAGGPLPKLMTVPSPSHDISRTHVKVEPVGRAVQVTDMHSTNGTVLITGPISGDASLAGQRHQLVPGEPVAVQPGWVLDLGDGVTILIDRA